MLRNIRYTKYGGRPLDREALLNEILDALPEIMRRLVHKRSITPKEMELTMAQMRALRTITDNPNCTMGELAKKLGIGMSTATALVDRLVQRGVVNREGSRDDRRVIRVRLSATGRRTHNSIVRGVRRRMEAATGSLSTAEVAQIATSLKLFRKALRATDREEVS